MKNLSAVILLLVLSPGPLRAAAGSTAMPFLKLDQGARAAAMAGAYCAAGDDAWAVFYNPAGTALSARKEIVLGHNEWLEGLRNESAAYIHPLTPTVTLFGGVNALLSGGMDKYDLSGQKTGSFNAQEGALGFGVSGALGGGYYGGAAVKGLYQKAAGDGASAWAGDAGLLKVFGDWRVGLSAANLGGALKLGGTSFSLPLMLRAGASWNFLALYRVSGEVIKAGESAVSAAVGAEAEILSGPAESFFARAGFRTGRSRYAGSGLSAGLGLRNRDLRVDYAFTPYGELGDSHRLTISLRFGEDRPAPFRRAGSSLPQRRVIKEAPAKQRGGKTKSKKGEKNEVYFMW